MHTSAPPVDVFFYQMAATAFLFFDQKDIQIIPF